MKDARSGLYIDIDLQMSAKRNWEFYVGGGVGGKQSAIREQSS